LDIRARKKIVAKLQYPGDPVTEGEHRVASLGKSDDVEQGLFDVEIAAIRTGTAGVGARLISVRYGLMFKQTPRMLYRARLNHVSLCLPTECPVNSCDSSQSNATSVTSVTCTERQAAICFNLHRESAVFWLERLTPWGRMSAFRIF
jgi:hypothetical protein